MRKPLLAFTLALLLAAAFCAGLAHLFILRSEGGDVYPPYSTLRADPLGTKGIFDALDQLPEVEARRNFRPLPRLKPDGPITLVYAGVSHSASWEDRELLAFSALVLNGSRAIFTFATVDRAPTPAEQKRDEKMDRERKKKARKKAGGTEKNETKKKDGTPGAKDATKSPRKKDGDESLDESDLMFSAVRSLPFREVAQRWGFSFSYLAKSKTDAEKRRAVLRDQAGKLEPGISWHSVLCFKDLKPEWKTIYECEGQPVVIARSFGSGSIVLAAESFFLSNEAMRAERHPHLLAWIFAGPRTLIFDEEHHGVSEDLGIASLARKYRLHGVVAGLALLAALFVWKNSVRFIPPHASMAASEPVIGKESAEGFANLLRRTIRPSEILTVCLSEWRKAFPHSAREQTKIDAVLAVQKLSAKRPEPLGTYRAIANALSRH